MWWMFLEWNYLDARSSLTSVNKAFFIGQFVAKLKSLWVKLLKFDAIYQLQPQIHTQPNIHR